MPAVPFDATSRPTGDGRRGRRLRASTPLVLAVAAAVAAACSDTGTDPSAAVSIAFDTLPAPAVVVGDTIRDPATGEVRPLTARAYNGRNELIPQAPFTYFVPDTSKGLSVAGDLVVGGPKALADSVRVVAALGSLQLARGIFVVPKPDRLLPPDTTIDTLTLTNLDVTSGALSVKVVHDSTNAAPVPVRGWVVFFTLAPPTPVFADSVRLVDASGNLKTNDTTNDLGTANARVRVFVKKIPGNPNNKLESDSVVVTASARYKGSKIAGSPVQLVLPLRGLVPP